MVDPLYLGGLALGAVPGGVWVLAAKTYNDGKLLPNNIPKDLPETLFRVSMVLAAAYVLTGVILLLLTALHVFGFGLLSGSVLSVLVGVATFLRVLQSM